jgi:hypothetical protein
VGSPLVAAAGNDTSCAAAEWDAVRLGTGGLAEHTARWLRLVYRMEVIDLTNEPLPPALPPMLPAAAAAAQPEVVDLVSDSSSEDLTPDSEEGASDESSEEETLAQRRSDMEWRA